MRLAKQIEQAALGPIYRLAIWLRGGSWRIRRPLLIGVRALIVRDGAILLIRHRSGNYPWALPGGGVERNERLAEAAQREAREETGIHIRVELLLGMYERFGDGISNYIAVFVCTALGEPQPPRSIEIAEARFFPLQRLPSGTEAGTRRRVADYLAGERGITRLW
jgi:ADP-ribose pyrophosphatase YjhB (NUDIX family)